MPLFEGEHTFTRVSLYGHVFGWIAGMGLVIALSGSVYSGFGLYMMAFGVFHELEYLLTSMYNLKKLTIDSYIINQSNEYQYAIAVALVEYWVEVLLFPSMKTFTSIQAIGLIMVVVGQLFRSLAMFHAKSNFSHIIVTKKETSHQLVTTGVYSITRHPSYFGFFWFSVGTQLLLCNPICVPLYFYASMKFFSDRVPFEEEFLEKFFDKEYVEYKKRTILGFPLFPHKPDPSDH